MDLTSECLHCVSSLATMYDLVSIILRMRIGPDGAASGREPGIANCERLNERKFRLKTQFKVWKFAKKAIKKRN